MNKGCSDLVQELFKRRRVMFEKSKYALPKNLERKVTPKNYGQLIARQGKKKRKRPKK